jgi:8-oxo-dGTP diphosphatase
LIDGTIEREYGNRLRLRVAGICIENEKILLVDHSGLNKADQFWAPPGGGLLYGESIMECLKREFKEETGLNIQVGEFLCVSEYLKPPLHAVELFFEVTRIGGVLESGSDPEVLPEDQIIKKVEFLNFDILSEISDSNKHNLLKGVLNSRDLRSKYGYSNSLKGGKIDEK